MRGGTRQRNARRVKTESKYQPGAGIGIMETHDLIVSLDLSPESETRSVLPRTSCSD